ncbi:hypothetical protein OsccyDRAFT_4359 [Leptolyngbyaceae cyanobacterium JSC-12]|nr:hypothetical protein OsccyDRAFT_4359 [Leptolyngbyaceae cyanobacterium JSC-12]
MAQKAIVPDLGKSRSMEEWGFEGDPRYISKQS